MLDFYLGTGGIESPGKHLGGLDMYMFVIITLTSFLWIKTILILIKY